MDESTGIASKIVTHVRAPILAVPEGLEQFALNRALIAWDGRAPIANTLRGVVPLLALTSRVKLFMARNSHTETEPREAAEYLCRYGVNVEVLEVEDRYQLIDWLIREESRAFRADYIVMGAGIHGRIIECIGGITKRVLADSTVPLILGQ